MFPIIIAIFSTLVLVLIICVIIGTIIIMRRMKLRKNQIKSVPNIYDFELEEVYDEVNNEYEPNHYLSMNLKLGNYDIAVYDQINQNELDVQTNETVECTQIS